MKRFAFSPKHKHRQQAYFTGGSFSKAVDVIQLGNNGTIAAPDLITGRYYHSIALLNTTRAPDVRSLRVQLVAQERSA